MTCVVEKYMYVSEDFNFKVSQKGAFYSTHSCTLNSGHSSKIMIECIHM